MIDFFRNSAKNRHAWFIQVSFKDTQLLPPSNRTKSKCLVGGAQLSTTYITKNVIYT